MNGERFRWKVVLEVDGAVRQMVVEAPTVWDAVLQAKGVETDSPRLLLITIAEE